MLHNFALLPTLNKLVKKMTSLDPNKDILLDVSNLNVTFELKNASVKAVTMLVFM